MDSIRNWLRGLLEAVYSVFRDAWLAFVLAAIFAVLVAIGDEDFGLLAPREYLDELTTADWIWIGALAVAAFSLGRISRPHRARDAYRAVGDYWGHALTLLLMADAGVVAPPRIGGPGSEVTVSADIDRFWLKVPAEHMVARLRCDVRLSLWAVRGGEIRLIAGPEHEFTCATEDSLLHLMTRRWEQEPEATAPTLADTSDPKEFERALQVFEDRVRPVFDLALSLEPPGRHNDIDTFVSWGQEALLAVPLILDGTRAWIVALSPQRGVFGDAEQRYLRYLSISLARTSQATTMDETPEGTDHQHEAPPADSERAPPEGG